jgi:LAS superfamily LD-carboxypeptidase LdcB
MKKSFLIPFIIVLAAAGAYLIYLQWQNKLLKEQSKTLTEQLESTSDSLSKIQNQNRSLMTSLIEAVGKAANYSSVLNQTSQKVSDLEELTNTDPQLLYKYSKVFFLNENYTPPAVTPIDPKYLYNKDKPMDFHERAWPFLKNLLDAAERDGIDLKVISAYRSFGTQAALKSSYKVTYGAGTANSFSADQGYSEHQLATTLDFTTSSVGATFSGFEKTPAYKWLVANAHIYGFILSYPQENSFYVYEPWHWRFVGLDLAQKLRTDGKYFYDLDQREINTYLGKIWNATPTSTYR